MINSIMTSVSWLLFAHLAISFLASSFLVSHITITSFSFAASVIIYIYFYREQGHVKVHVRAAYATARFAYKTIKFSCSSALLYYHLSLASHSYSPMTRDQKFHSSHSFATSSVPPFSFFCDWSSFQPFSFLTDLHFTFPSGCCDIVKKK